MSDSAASVIHRLAPNVVNQIAAGEVVQRPANAIKEMIENALDANATDIRVEIEQGGKRRISIADNGSGIASADLSLALERHATSKISTIDDLYEIASFGFRGEALAAIGAVSDLTLTSYAQSQPHAWALRCVHGRVEPIQPATRTRGTTVEVQNLFAEIPARLKFLKTDATEWAEIRRTVTSYALANPSVAFSLKHDQLQVYQLNPVQLWTTRVTEALGERFGASPIEFKVDGPMFSLHVITSEPRLHAGRADVMYCYVNGRWVLDKLVQSAVTRAMRKFIPDNRFPRIVAFLQVDPKWVDVNVHPAKTEVRFRDGQLVYDFLYKSIVTEIDRVTRSPFAPELPSSQSNEQSADPRDVPSSSMFSYSDDGRRPTAPSIAEGAMPRGYPSGGEYRGGGVIRASDPTVRAYLPQLPAGGGQIQSPVQHDLVSPSFQYVGVIAAKYLIVDRQGQLEVVDQHAAHERVYYGRFYQALMGTHSVERQRLLVPLRLQSSAIRKAALGLHQERLGRLGFDLVETDHGMIEVQATPVWFRGDVQLLLADLLDGLAELGGSDDLEDRISMIAASRACRAAIKANSRLSEPEAVALLQQLGETEHAVSCPHGRPTRIRFSTVELDRLFQRLMP